MMFKPLSSENSGTIYRLLSETYEKFLKENPIYREAWRSNWKEYDSAVHLHPDTVGACGFFSYVDGKVVGFASFDPRGNTGRVVIGHNCILPRFQGRGYGTRQMCELLRVLKQRRFRKAVVTTARVEFLAPALRMYRFCGFKEIRRSTDPVSGLKTIELECDLSVNIRRARKNDFKQVLALFRQLWPDKDLNRERQEIVYNAMLESEGYELLCAERKNRVIAFASVSIQHNFWQEGQIAYITTLIVEDGYRQRGIGSMLICEIQEIARRSGCKKIELESAFHRERAHSFYEKMGFEKRAYFFSKALKSDSNNMP